MSLQFEKWHGLGNDFVVVADVDPAAWRPRAVALCRRGFGVGADGVLVVDPNAPRVAVINADGSEPEMCGNGVRCVAGWLVRRGHQQIGATFELSTGAGNIPVTVHAESPDGTYTVNVLMGTPSFSPADAGVDSDAPWLEASGVGQGVVVSIGNPHWIFLDPPDGSDVRALGPRLEHDARFARRTNVEFVRRVGAARYRVDVWERGVGVTLACGSGAVCVAAALVRAGREPAEAPIAIVLPGGELTCVVDRGGAVEMIGEAQLVYEGTIALG